MPKGIWVAARLSLAGGFLFPGQNRCIMKKFILVLFLIGFTALGTWAIWRLSELTAAKIRSFNCPVIQYLNAGNVDK